MEDIQGAIFDYGIGEMHIVQLTQDQLKDVIKRYPYERISTVGERSKRSISSYRIMSLRRIAAINKAATDWLEY